MYPINDNFTPEVARRLVDLYGKAKIITATNMFAHIDDLYSFMAGIVYLLKDDGVFVIEVHHALSIIKDMEYDSIYHEHMSYYTINPLWHLAENFGMYVSKAEKIPIHGGSLRIYFKKGNEKSWGLKIALEETEAGLHDVGAYDVFCLRAEKSRIKLHDLLKTLTDQGYTISGYGCPAKANTIINSASLGEYIDYMIDTTPAKQGKYTPNSHIPIYPTQYFYDHPTDYAILFPWNYAKEILEKEKDYKGKFIHPLTGEIIS